MRSVNYSSNMIHSEDTLTRNRKMEPNKRQKVDLRNLSQYMEEEEEEGEE